MNADCLNTIPMLELRVLSLREKSVFCATEAGVLQNEYLLMLGEAQKADMELLKIIYKLERMKLEEKERATALDNHP